MVLLSNVFCQGARLCITNAEFDLEQRACLDLIYIVKNLTSPNRTEASMFQSAQLKFGQYYNRLWKRTDTFNESTETF